ncbi:MAG: YigZ family protein [Bacteroidales bacterium]|nr:YigZ family protein [Bacteroidales bacterium]
MLDDTYRTLAAPVEGQYKEKGSKFLSFAFPVSTEEEAKALLCAKRKEYFDAHHHCYAYVIGADKETYRLNDDGEPSGTAGRPIHGQMMSFNLTDALVLVVRYFGGVKLGVSGLSQAYRAAAHDALAHAAIVEKTINEHFRLEFEYALLNDVMRLLKQYGIPFQDQQFGLQCVLRIGVRRSMVERVRTSFSQLRGVVMEEI